MQPFNRITSTALVALLAIVTAPATAGDRVQTRAQLNAQDQLQTQNQDQIQTRDQLHVNDLDGPTASEPVQTREQARDQRQIETKAAMRSRTRNPQRQMSNPATGIERAQKGKRH